MGRRDLDRLISSIMNKPLLTTEATAWTILDVLSERRIASADALAQPNESAGRADDEPYMLAGDIAIIPVRGELVNRGSWLDAQSGLTSYDKLQGSIRKAERDRHVRAAVLDIDSPGGEAAGAIETAAAVRLLSASKPVVAFVNGIAASAAYAIAAGASEIVTTPSATLGSIGVVWLHMDRSKMMETAGLKPTLLHAGAFKTDGNTLQELAPQARARIQNLIDTVFLLLTASVGEHRPKLGQDGAKATEAGIFMGQGAVDAGLADRVGNLSFALDRARARAAALPPRGGPTLSTPSVISGGLEKEAYAKAFAEGETKAYGQAALAERGRCAKIILSPEGKSRYEFAKHLALRTELTAVEAIAVLAAAPEFNARSPRLHLIAPRICISPDLSPDEPQNEYQAGAQAAAELLDSIGVRPKGAQLRRRQPSEK